MEESNWKPFYSNSNSVQISEGRRRFAIIYLILAFSFIASTNYCSMEKEQSGGMAESEIRMNQIQVIGSHNSYKLAISPSLMQILERDDPDSARNLDYEHIPIRDQLDLGLRILELDVYYDPEGGRYANPAGIRIVEENNLPPGPEYDANQEMEKPGFKVLHVQGIDFRSHFFTLNQALSEIRDWSRSNPQHLPIVITFNAKDEVLDEHPEFGEPLPFDESASEALDLEILGVFDVNDMILPHDVKGDYPTLEQAVRAGNWPTIQQSRGKMLFVLDETGRKQEVYLRSRPSLEDRILFVNAAEGEAEAAFLIINDPIDEGKNIQRLVRSGFLVRTRADADTIEARNGDRTRLEAAFQSGAQFISTDYYLPNPRFGTGYQVQFPDGTYSRWNPVTLEKLPVLPLKK